MTKKKEIELVRLADIEADVLQPRKNFSPERMQDLIKSIKQHGIINPLIVESAKGGRFILVDGERRFRAAKELKLQEVPVVVVAPQNEVDRLVQQFHLQEQHENWSPVEKANAVSRLADELHIPIQQLADTLSLPRETISNYVAYSKLLEKSYFEKSETPISYAKPIITIKEFTRKHYLKTLEKEFTTDKARKLERSIITRIKEGVITRASDVAKLRDAIRANPRMADKIIEDEHSTPDSLFLESKAQAAWTYRNIVNLSSILASHIKTGLNLKVQNYFEEELRAKNIVKLLKERVDELASKL